MKAVLSLLSAVNMIFTPIGADLAPVDAGATLTINQTSAAVLSPETYLQELLPPVELPAVEQTVAQVVEEVTAPEPEPEPEPTMTLLGTYKLTAYCPCQKCCGKAPGSKGYGITASGAVATEGVTIAMKGLPFGTRVYIEGIGERVVQDRGVSGKRIDVFCSTHKACFNALYNRSAQVWIIE